MFKGKKKAKIDPNTTDTLIGEGTTFEGKIKSEAGLRIEGQMIGDIDCAGDITIGENGIARSHVKARNVVIAGQVMGNVSASAKLTIKATGQLHGNLSAHELSIESGGVFQGSSNMDVAVAAEEQTSVNAVANEPEPSAPAPSANSAPAPTPAPAYKEGESVLKPW
ncbi:bactofilin family protein [Cohnella terricola]|uniref:Polymer-forming cytoskeletal protein n=1 Tax=Cohnella terricola TaxID=1289167 RepID=A0A559JST0_9BACL|nr:polymer-forming cytoskeletal protein [Cohnella terricola]TVY02942.1 polymer-forming cytoskeletal protein [Cohnella terricola]